jgi:hypothetical protein
MPLRRKAIQAELRSLVDHDLQFQVRTRFTVAEVNAGATVLPAILPNFGKYRLIDIALIAIGGAASGATDVRILGTQAGASVALLIAAVAGLTQNTLLRAGAANATILAGGLSFVANDANTAITVGKTGGSLATSTHIDVLLEYAIERASVTNIT